MTQQTLIRVARPDDLSAVDALLGRSYPRLLKGDYPPSIMVTIVPVISRAKPELLASGRYFLVEDMDGRVLGAGGYSLSIPNSPDAMPDAAPESALNLPPNSAAPVLAHIRHVATDPDALRQGVGRRLMQAIFTAAAAEGAQRYDCLSTLTAVPFYRAVGFKPIGAVHIPILPGMTFAAVRMWRGQ